jgi:hypothetical protein
MRWLYELGTDVERLQEAEATARREAKYHFVKQQPTLGRRRMWEANQIRDRIAQLQQLPQPPAPAPAEQPTFEEARQVERLQAHGIYPDNARRFAHVPPATIARAEELASAINGNTPALIVAFLTRHVEEGWAIPAPSRQAIYEALDLSRYTGDGKHATFFQATPAAEPAAYEPPSWWQDPAAWSTLPEMLQLLLEGSQLDGGEILADTEFRNHQLHRSYGDQLAALVQRSSCKPTV